MNEAIERVAIAFYGNADTWRRFLSEADKDFFRAKARRGLEAIREPTDEMARAGLEVRNGSDGACPSNLIYKKMIDEALR